MADKSFEQRVKEELGSLKMRPDAEVWAKVEAGLYKKKKRRWFVWLFLFAGLAGASVVGYWTREGKLGEETREQGIGNREAGKKTGEQQKQQAQELSTHKTGKEQTVGEQNKENGSVDALHATSKSVSLVKSPVDEKKAGGTGNREVIAGKNKRLETFTNGSLVQQPASAENDKGVSDQQTAARNKAGSETVAANTQGASKDTKEGNEPKGNSSQQVVADTKQPAVKETVAPGLEKTPAPGLSSPDTVHKAQPAISKKAVKNKWELSIGIEGGKTGLRTSFGSFVFADRSYSVAPPLNNGNPGFPGTIVTPTPPSLKDAFAFGVSFTAKKQLDQTFSLGISGSYTLEQTETTVGRRIDSTTYFSQINSYNENNFYYVGSANTPYTNRYHFFRMGAELYTAFNLFKNISVRWELGGGVALLLGSNGLHYDASTGRSFQNNNLLTKVQSYVSTGIDIGIGRKPFVYIGPHWQYNLGHLTTTATSGEHLLMRSIQLSFPLQRKAGIKK